MAALLVELALELQAGVVGFGDAEGGITKRGPRLKPT
jgi:hypothetical protein